jgi:hypothetical protein
MRIRTRFYLIVSLVILLGVSGTALVHYLVLRAELTDIRKKTEIVAVRTLTDNIDGGVRSYVA